MGRIARAIRRYGSGWTVRLVVGLTFCWISQSLASLKPWGELQKESIILEPPDEYLSDTRFTPDKLHWFVPTNARTNFLEQLNAFDLTREQHAKLKDFTHWRSSTNGWRYSPDRELLLDLSSLGRTQIYTLLSKYPENIYQRTPFILSSPNVDACLANSGLSVQTLNQLKRLLYKRESCWCFSDMAVPPHEFKQLLKTLCRIPSLILKLHITPASDVDALVRYWGKQETATEAGVLLKSLAKMPQGATLDIVHLLPRFARERLYRFPDKSEHEILAQQNCFWTALNFFNGEPDDRFGDNEFLNETIKTKYARTNDDPQFGDVVGLADDSGRIIHCSVYIADETVFTKNGGYRLKPWVLMTIPDMMARYSMMGAHQLVTFRSKATSTAQERVSEVPALN
jgi:hypothetical protein